MSHYFQPELERDELLQISSLGLAHLGDAVYELLVRSWLCTEGKVSAGELHQATVKRVRASAQAAAAERLLPLLSEEELDVFKRARNAKSHTAPKAAGLGDYHKATALEALFGWLYLKGQKDRISDLFAVILEAEG